jgi:ABC-type protease/lipase transport system fused ATPase/permease subunit
MTIEELKERQGICVLVTHREELLSLCDLVFAVEDGKLVQLDSVHPPKPSIVEM